jgi:hypothetical protein
VKTDDPCLAGACLYEPVEALQHRLGLHPLPPDVFSWVIASPDSGLFLELSVDSEVPAHLSVVFITSIPQQQAFSTVRQRGSVPAPSLRQGIGLGASQADVLAAYGSPTNTAATAGYPWSATSSGITSLTYSHCNDGTYQPELTFFIQAGRVVGIAFWGADC